MYFGTAPPTLVRHWMKNVHWRVGQEWMQLPIAQCCFVINYLTMLKSNQERFKTPFLIHNLYLILPYRMNLFTVTCSMIDFELLSSRCRLGISELHRREPPGTAGYHSLTHKAPSPSSWNSASHPVPKCTSPQEGSSGWQEKKITASFICRID